MKCVFRLLPVLLAFAAATAFADYRLPSPDDDTNASPPSLTATLTEITAEAVTVQPASAQAVSVRITPETRCWTVYGGLASLQTLPVDQPVEIWFTAESIKAALKPPVAAVVRAERRK
jgi:hypothetical protein